MKQWLWLLVLVSYANFADFDVLDGISVPTSKLSFKPNWRPFLVPNETSPSNFGILQLRDPSVRGLQVSVGTFRALVIFGWATHTTHLLMADIDQRVVDFNKTHLRFIKCIADGHPGNFRLQRVHYLAAMHRLSLPDTELLELAGRNKVTARKVRRLAAANLGNNSAITDECLLRAFKESPALKDMTLNNIFDTMFDYELITDEHYYWDDDVQWQKIVDAITHEKIAATNLSISPVKVGDADSDDDISALFKFISDLQIDFGIFDVSNTPTFNKKIALNKPWATFLTWTANKPRLILLTEQPHLYFRYHSYSFDEFLQFLTLH